MTNLRGGLFIGLALSLTGCNEWKHLTGTGDIPVAAVAPPTALPPAPAYHVFIADGQSNMGGKDQGPNFPPMPHYVGSLAGPAYGFALAYLQAHPDRYVRTVNCSLGGTSVVAHQEGLPLFEICLDNVREQAGASAVVEGILWWQGEADASTGMSGAVWSGYFSRYIAAMRRRLNNPRLPVVFVQLGVLVPLYNGAVYTAPTWDEIKEAQAAFAEPSTNWVKSEDQTLADYVHYTASSHLIIGARMFSAWCWE